MSEQQTMRPPGAEFLARAAKGKEGSREKAEAIDVLFELFDADGDGMLNLSEIQRLFTMARGEHKAAFPDRETFQSIAGDKPGLSKSDLKSLFSVQSGYLWKIMAKIRKRLLSENSKILLGDASEISSSAEDFHRSRSSNAMFSADAKRNKYRSWPGLRQPECSSKTRRSSININEMKPVATEPFSLDQLNRSERPAVRDPSMLEMLMSAKAMKRPLFSAAVRRTIEALSVFTENDTAEEAGASSDSPSEDESDDDKKSSNVIMDEFTDYAICQDFIRLFAPKGKKRLNLTDMQQLFEAAGAAHEEAPYPDFSIYALFADTDAMEGMDAKELHTFLSQEPGYIERLHKAVMRWSEAQKNIKAWATGR